MSVKAPPANADAALVRAFRSAGKDGQVSKADVENTIGPLIKDGRGLSAREKATLTWAVEAFDLTSGGKQALSGAITEAAGGAVFPWQRELKGPVAVQLGAELPRARLDRTAADAFMAVCRSVPGADEPDATYAHPESGNDGTHLFALEGPKAEQHLKYLVATADKPELLKDVSTKTHAVYSVYESDDESHFGGILVDRKTGKATALEAFNIVDIPYDRKQFEAIFGPVVDGAGRRVSDDEFEEKSQDVDIHDRLMGGRSIALPHYSKADVARREGPLNRARLAITDAFEKNPTTHLVKFDYNVMARTEDLAGQLAGLVESAHDVDWRDKARAGAKMKVLEPFRKFDEAAQTAVTDAFKAGSSSLKDGKVKALLDGLGASADFMYASVQLPMTVKDGRNRDKNMDVVAHILVNQRDGDYLTVYERARTPGD